MERQNIYACNWTRGDAQLNRSGFRHFARRLPKWFAVSLVAVFCVSVTGGAAAVTIDFESFADMQNIDGLDLGGVTITNPSGNVEIYESRFGVASNSGTNAIGSFTGNQNNNPMTFTFDVAVTSVSLYAGDGGTNGEIDSWSFEVFDAQVGGNSLGFLSSGDFIGFPYVQLAFSGVGDILRAEANWTGQVAGIGYDDLEFTTIPIPAASILFLSGLSLFGLVTRRRQSDGVMT